MRLWGGSFMSKPNRLLALGLSAVVASVVAATASAEPICDTSGFKIEPEYRFQEEDFTADAAEETLNALRGPIIEWVDELDELDREIDLTSGELGMAYLNNLNHLRGYVLRQKALDEQAGGEPGEHTATFCDFLREVPIID